MLAGVLACGLFVCSVGQAMPPVVDGDITDWPDGAAMVADARGDASGRFDLLACRALATNGRLFLAIETATPLNLIAGHGDDGTLVITMSCASSGKSVRIDTRSRSVTGDGGAQLVWDDIGYRAMPTIASSLYELSVSLEALGASAGDEISVRFGGSDSFDKPLVVEAVSGPNVMAQPRTAMRSPGTDFRIASINTLRDGTHDERRGPVLAGVLDGLSPDIVCLQEEWGTSVSEVSAWLERADPREDGLPWRVHKSNGNMIAVPSAYELVPFEAGYRHFAGAIVDDGERALAVVSLHLKCCGYAGSEEDLRRIEQAEQLRDVLLAFRAGALGDELAPYAEAPIVLVGDWNLVGSGGALTTILEAERLSMVDAMPARLSGDDFSTWRDLTPDPGGFPAGRLDLLVHSADHPPLRSFLFESSDLDRRELDRLGIARDASRASDHLLIVADYAVEALPEAE